MILADTSVWINHFRTPIAQLALHLQWGEVLMHPIVLGEVVMSLLKDRRQVISLLQDLPQAPVVDDAGVRGLVEREQLFGVGIGYIDAHLLAATLVASGCLLWTFDNRLQRVAKRLERAAHLSH